MYICAISICTLHDYYIRVLMIVYYRVSHDSIIKSVSNILYNDSPLKIIIIISI